MAYYSRYYRTTGFTLPSSFGTFIYDTHDFSSDSDTAYDTTTGSFVAPETADYVIHSSFSVSRSWQLDSQCDSYIDVEGSNVSSIVNSSSTASNTFAKSQIATCIVPLTVGDLVQIKARSNFGGSPTTAGNQTDDVLFIYTLGGYSGNVVRASRATTFAATSSFVTMPFSTVQIDNLGSYNPTTGVYTAKANGIYDVSAITAMNAAWTTNTGPKLAIYKNGSLHKYVPNTSEGSLTYNMIDQVRDLLSLSTNDTVTIRVAQDLTTSVNTLADATKNVFTCYRIA